MSCPSEGRRSWWPTRARPSGSPRRCRREGVGRAGGRVHRRFRPKPRRLVPPAGGRAGRAPGPRPPCRSARPGREPLRRQPAYGPPDRRLHHSGGAEVLEPRFTLHGFRYAGISGLSRRRRPRRRHRACSPFRHTPDRVLRVFLVGINKLFTNIDWGQRGNFISVPTDCPQHDERLGWLGDAQVFVRTAAYNRDVASFFSKWLDDVSDAQLPSGAFTDFAPRLDTTGRPRRPGGTPVSSCPGPSTRCTGTRGCWSATSRPWRHGWASCPDQSRPAAAHAAGAGNYGDWLAPKGD